MSNVLRRALPVVVASFTLATSALGQGPMPSDDWLKGITAKNKQFFDAPAPGGGIALVHIMNYYDTYNKAYNVKDADIDAVLTFYGSTTLYAMNDARPRRDRGLQ